VFVPWLKRLYEGNGFGIQLEEPRESTGNRKWYMLQQLAWRWWQSDKRSIFQHLNTRSVATPGTQWVQRILLPVH